MIQSHGAKYDCNLQRQHAERDAKVTSAMDVARRFRIHTTCESTSPNIRAVRHN